MAKRWVTFFGVNMRETTLAVLLDIDGEEVWIPKSQMNEWPEEEGEGDVVMTEWIAFENGLI